MLEPATPTLNRVDLAPSEGTRPPPPASHHAHFSGALLAPTFRPVEPRAPLSLPPGGQSSRRGGILGAGSSGVRSLGFRPRFFPPARCLFSSFLGARESWLLCLGSGSAEVRNQFWKEKQHECRPRDRKVPSPGAGQAVAPGWLGSTAPAQRGTSCPGCQGRGTQASLLLQGSREPLSTRAATAAPSQPRPGPVGPAGLRPSHLRVGLENVVLDAALRAELLRTQQTAVLPHKVVSLQGKGRPAPEIGPRPQPLKTRSSKELQGPWSCPL